MLSYVKKTPVQPGDKIHCPKAEDARKLRRYLEAEGFTENRDQYSAAEITDDLVYSLGNGRYFWQYSYHKPPVLTNRILGYPIIEFSDLVFPESQTGSAEKKSELSGLDILKWLEDHCRDRKVLREVFDDDICNLGSLLDEFTPEGIVARIAAYEAAKTAELEM